MKFTHTPRPAIVPVSHPSQRYFGENSHDATCGILNNRGVHDATASVYVTRIGHMPDAASLEVTSYCIDSASFSFSVKLRADQLRELARCLLDAASDIEAHPAQGGA